MSEEKTPRWKERLVKFGSALARLVDVVALECC